MLVLSRKQSEQIVVGRDIRITVVKVDRNQVRLGIEAPRGVAILREELTSEWLADGPDGRSGHIARKAAGRGLTPPGGIEKETGASGNF